ncbi:NAD-dependent epimerase/dehydratase family protein [Methylomonas methanica]|uniref:Epimerase n=1 Tax=Methylomonas methanica TaxID=421 RepID=A0A177MNT4_METMH|nr:NAD-dependent epimerase/dehydratase [Methylomonas methanica]OAI07115.1 epimerase [Methylomonas methanica]
MRVLVTGVTGYLGSHLATELLKEGHEVIALKRKLSSLNRIQAILPRLALYNLEETNLAELFAGFGKFDAIIHTATCYGRNGESISQITEANLLFPLKLLEAAVFGNVDVYINTDTALDKLLNPYTLSKGQFSEWGKYFAHQEKIRFINLRLEHFYGAGDDDSKFTTHVINSCLANVPELNLTLGEQRRDFIHINDVITAYLLLLNKRDAFADWFIEFAVGSGVAVTIRQFVETVHNLTASTTRLNFGVLPYRAGESMLSQANVSALQALGWHCDHDLVQGLQMTIKGSK